MRTPNALSTRAEHSAYTETSTHADVLAFIEALRAFGDDRLRVANFGTTPEGRLLPLLILSNRGCFITSRYCSIHRFAMTYDVPHVIDSGRREPIENMRNRLLPAVQVGHSPQCHGMSRATANFAVKVRR